MLSKLSKDAIEERKVYRLVLTGGPCGGKTTGQSRLCTFFENLGWKVLRVPETATILFSGGIDRADVDADADLKFQEHLLRTMLEVENTYFAQAMNTKKNCLIICDRGFMDGSAYISTEQWDRIMRSNGWDPVKLRDNRYNQIIHMVSAANGAEEFYSTEEHSCRSEDLALARQLDKRTASAWIGHPSFDIIDNSTDFENKVNRMIECVCQKLGIDIGDRLSNTSRKVKFLVSDPMEPDSSFPEYQDFWEARYYLQPADPRLQGRLDLRCQKGSWSYYLTIRMHLGDGESIQERKQLSPNELYMWIGFIDKDHEVIVKVRRCFVVDNQYFQMDVFMVPSRLSCEGVNQLAPYILLTGDKLKNILPELTGQPDYSMITLSLREDEAIEQFCLTHD